MEVTGLGSSEVESTSSIVKEGEGKSELGEVDFMLLLIEQMKNQDPLNPMDNSEFTAQMAQFNSLDQLINVNENLETILLTQSSLNNAAAVNLIGKNIEMVGNEIHLTSEGADISYELPQAATSASISIYDSNHSLVTILSPVPQEEGAHTVHWDGLDGDGDTAPEGTYSFVVSAKDAEGEAIDALEFIVGEATDLIFEENATYLIVNGEKVPLSEILKVSES